MLLLSVSGQGNRRDQVIENPDVCFRQEFPPIRGGFADFQRVDVLQIHSFRGFKTHWQDVEEVKTENGYGSQPRTPSEHPNPHEHIIRPTWVVHLVAPKWDFIGVGPRPSWVVLAFTALRVLGFPPPKK